MRFSFSALSLALVGSAAAAPHSKILGFLQQFSDDFTYPRIIEGRKGINYTGLRRVHVVGRVDITEPSSYFFGLFAGLANSNSTPLIGIPLNGTLTNLVVDNNFVLTRLCATSIGLCPLREVWPKLAKHLIVELGLPADTSDTVALQTRAAIDICSTHEYCLGPNQQYNSTKSCMDFVLHQIPFGEGGRAGRTRRSAAIFTLPMRVDIAFRPSVHCPHVGPSGGDMCFDHPYETTSFLELPRTRTL
ncbi:hypothetical protein C8R46DRAFT_1154709 [Mycena filopes]|nr:hypothetical protein C8R46DRAFT_1154709 [Mycena filopes]